MEIPGLSTQAFKPGGYEQNRNKYNGIEFDTAFGLYDYEAHFRNLDPAIGRWSTIDPSPNVSESPYSSMGDNPARNVDPLGDTTKPKYPEVPKWLTIRNVNKDGDQTGVIRNATQDEYKENKGKALAKDFVHALYEVTGLNAVDDAFGTLKSPDATKTDKVAAFANALLMLPGEGGFSDDALVVRGGTNTPELNASGISTHPEGVTGLSVECGTCSVKELASNLPGNYKKIGVTTVGAVRKAGGDVIKTSGRSPTHATLTGLPPETSSQLFNPIMDNPAKK